MRAAEFASTMFGPLVGPECRRAVRRGWLVLVRSLSAIACSAVAVAILWWWWLNQNEGVDPGFSPFEALRVGLIALLGLGATIALALGPAVTAGCLSADRERGSMGLLLTTRVNALEIVLGRMSGRISQVAMVLLAGLPPFLLLAWLAGIGPVPLGVMVLDPLALTIGSGGITAGLAAFSRRGRDTMLGAYVVVLAMMLGPMLASWIAPTGGGGAVLTAVARLNPFGAIGPLVWSENPIPAVQSMALWLALGLIGFGLSVGRLRPNCLRWLGSEAPRTRLLARRRWRVPPIGDRPMLWKELYIERAGSLGGIGKWLGYLAVAYLLLASTILGAGMSHALFWERDMAEADRILVYLQQAIVDTSTVFGILIQWSVGLRAAVAIGGEGNALLTSPLSGSEIVSGKLVGNLHALWWIFVATLFAWSLALGFGAMGPWEWAHAVLWTLVLSAFMAAVGVRASLVTTTASTAMAIAVGAWLVAAIAVSVLAWIVVGIGALVMVLSWTISVNLGLSDAPTPWFPVSGPTAFALVQLALFGLITVLLVTETRLRFDRLAGRMTSGAVSGAIDRVLHGQPAEPVVLDDRDDDLEEGPRPVLATPPTRPGVRDLGDHLG